jgi:outer membrane protein OmpA-like peptidoglycan-associated protein
MATGYSWSIARGGSYQPPASNRLGWWAAIAMIGSILLHVAVFFALEKMKVAIRVPQATELRTEPVAIRPVDIAPLELPPALPPEESVKPPENAAALLEEVDLLAALPKDQEIDMKPDVQQAEFALQMANPAAKGEPNAPAAEITSGYEFDSDDLPEIGRQPEQIRPAEVGQLTIDPGAMQADDDKLGKLTDAMIQQGAGGKVDRSALNDSASLDELLGLPANAVVAKKTMLPSDLLFEYNSAELRESAKVGLMKLALLMDRNPELYCWIEGHTDLIGGDDFNLDLSVRRAAAVKQYLVESLRMDASKISTRGFGRYEPLITQGSVQEQGANRRVEVRMRPSPPTKEQLTIQPQKAAVVVESPPPKAVELKPQRAIPVEEDAPAPRAMPIEE